MAEQIHDIGHITPITYEGMNDSIRAAVERGGVYIETSGIGAWEKIVVHPLNPADVHYFYNSFVTMSEDGDVGAQQTSVDIERFEGVFRRGGHLTREFVDLSPQEIQTGDKLALRIDEAKIGTSLKVGRLATEMKDALDLFEPTQS